MAERTTAENRIAGVWFRNNRYEHVEAVKYPNGGMSDFYVSGSSALILDRGICEPGPDDKLFPYSLITDKQNSYMSRYDMVHRFLAEDFRAYSEKKIVPDFQVRSFSREDSADASPLEFMFEQNFTNVYGLSALKYLNKEYLISDENGSSFYLDYVIHTENGDIAVEENGITYHHPQVIGEERYRRQLQKQNACTEWGIRLFRFSTEDCAFGSRIADDIRSYFGSGTDSFVEKGLLLERRFELYEHQRDTLQKIREQREKGVCSFLVVFPTASGKSRVIEEDLAAFIAEDPGRKALILAPSKIIVDDWNDRAGAAWPGYRDNIFITTYAYMMRHFRDYEKDHFDYIVVDEAHHAVSPVLKRVIQYFTPGFLIGLTATDERPDRLKLETVFGNYETELSLRKAMEKGIVAQANVYRIETNLDLSEVRFNGKDYVNADLERSIRVTSRNQLIADVIKEYFCEGEVGGRQGIIFCVNTEHAREMERVLQEAGISARAYSSREKDPAKIMRDFKEKKIRFLCACSMISEGWDYPELGILVMARPTISRVLYLQQIGRGLRKTDSKKNVFVVDVVDEYGAMAKPCSMHSIFANAYYVPFGNILKRDYKEGDIVVADGIRERVERIAQVDVETFEEKYGSYLNQEQLAREFFMSTGSIVSWIRKGKIQPSEVISFGSRSIYLFSPENVAAIRAENDIPEHNDETIKDDFFAFLEERDYSLSYKMPFLLSLLKNMNSIGDAGIDDILTDYIAFYESRLEKGLPVDRKTCPYTEAFLQDRKSVRQNMLANPFEKFERKRFLYYSKELGMISMNHALFSKLDQNDYEIIRKQMHEDLDNYYRSIGG